VMHPPAPVGVDLHQQGPQDVVEAGLLRPARQRPPRSV
jgi:hypothetical protein